jgi:hypothetical protein
MAKKTELERPLSRTEFATLVGLREWTVDRLWRAGRIVATYRAGCKKRYYMPSEARKVWAV